MTDPEQPTPETYAERVHREQAQRTAEREARRAAISYNRDAPTDQVNGDPA